MQFQVRYLCFPPIFHIMKQYGGKLNSTGPYLNQISSYYSLSFHVCDVQVCASMHTYMLRPEGC